MIRDRRYGEESKPILREERLEDEDEDLLEDYSKKKRRFTPSLHFFTDRQYLDENNLRILRKHLAIVFVVTVFIAAVIIIGVYELIIHTQSPSSEQTGNGRSFKTAAVAADTTLCSHVGTSMLLRGGNGVDASIAALLCSGLTCAQSMGIGGGFFMTIYNRTTGEATTIDARETAPAGASKDMFVPDPETSAVGGLSIAIPGEVRGYWYVHQNYGMLPWKDLFTPTIKMAADGFPVPSSLAQALQDSKEEMTTIKEFREIFVNPKTGELFKEGEIMKRTKLAKTLRVLSLEGEAAFYNGTLTDDILSDLEDVGSIITRQDLLNYSVLEKPAVEIRLDSGTRMMSLPAPSGGPVLAFLLNVMDGYKFEPKDIASDEAKTLTYHRIVEAFKFAYALRSHLGDEDFVNVTEVVRNLTSRAFADYIRTSLITDNETHNTSYYGGTFFDRLTTGTSHLSILDQLGNGVSTTSTINARFGSKRRGKRTGIIFNDEMDDFSSPNITSEWGVKPSPANFIVPGKRPLSSMCPAVLVDSSGDVVGVHGAAGGTKITSATAWVIAHSRWLGHDIVDAVSRARLHHQLLPPYIMYEANWQDGNVLVGLRAIGHDLKMYKLGSSISQDILVDKNSSLPIQACSDFRKGGIPDGF